MGRPASQQARRWDGSGVSPVPDELMFPQAGEQLDAEVKRYDDLEFQQLEQESRLEEEKETMSKQLLGEVAEYQQSIATREVSVRGWRGAHTERRR